MVFEIWRSFISGPITGIAVIKHVITAVAGLLLCHGPRWKKEDRPRIFLEFLVCAAFLIVGNAVVLRLLPDLRNLAWIIFMGIAGGVYLLLCADCGKRTAVLLWCASFPPVTCMVSAAGWIKFLFDTHVGIGIVSVFAGDLLFMLLIPLALYLRSMDFSRYGGLSWNGMALLVIGDVIVLFLSAYGEMLGRQVSYDFVGILIAFYVCILTAELLSVRVIYHMCEEHEKNLALQAEKQRLHADKELMRAAEASLETLRNIRHDLKNQYSYMQILLEGKRYEELREYFQQLVGKTSAQLSSIDCGNRNIDVVLNMELSKAKDAGVTFSCQLAVPPKLPFLEMELCAILMNLLDNAIEECCRLKEQGAREPGLQIEIRLERGYLLIVCRNTTDKARLERQEEGLRTTKDDGLVHGRGTRIIANLAEKYNGTVNYSLKDGQFIAKVMLDMQEGNTCENQDRPV